MIGIESSYSIDTAVEEKRSCPILPGSATGRKAKCLLVKNCVLLQLGNTALRHSTTQKNCRDLVALMLSGFIVQSYLRIRRSVSKIVQSTSVFRDDFGHNLFPHLKRVALR